MDNAPEPSPAPAPVPAAAAPLPGVGEILTAATTITFDNAGLLFGIWAACHLPPQVLGLILRSATGLADKDGVKTAIENHDFAALGALVVAGLIGMILGMLAQAAIILLAARVIRGREVGLGDLLYDGAGRLWSLFAASMIVGIVVGFGTLLLILPGLYLLFRLCLTSVATCADERGALDALSRSWAMTAGRFWDIAVFAGSLMLIGLGVALALIVVAVVLRVAAAAAGPAGAAASGVIVGLLQFLFSAWGTAALTKFYLELADRTPAAA